MRRNKNVKVMNWDDVYYDGRIDCKYQGFCEDTQQIIDLKTDDGWDRYEDLEEDVEWDD